MTTRVLDRIMDGVKTPEGKIIAILLALCLSLMSWNVAALSYALGNDGAVAGEQEAAEQQEAITADSQGDALEDEAQLAEDEAAIEEPAGEAAQDQAQDADALADADADATDADTTDEPAADADADEDVAYPAASFSGSANGVTVNVEAPEGAFPEETTMSVTTVASSQVVDAVEDAVEGEVQTIKAIDITFYNKSGKEIEPKSDIKVTFAAQTIAEADADDAQEISVVHIDESGVGEVVAQDATPATDEVAITSSDFSVYVIVTTGSSADSRLVVNFHDLGNNTTTIYVNKTDSDAALLGNLIYDPGIGGEIADGDLFLGWTYVQEYTPADGATAMNVQQLRTYIANLLDEGVEDGQVLDLYPMVLQPYHVTYVDEQGAVIQTDTALHRADAPAEYTVNALYVAKQQDENFEGWIAYEGADAISGNGYEVEFEGENVDVFANGTTVSLTGDVTMRPYVPMGQWLVFHENGIGATYTAAQFVKSGQTTTQPNDPTRFGYDFGGWYTTAAATEGTEFAFNQPLLAKTDLYAKWNPYTTASYTVIVWKQNAAGTGYDFATSIPFTNGTVGEAIGAVSQSGSGDSAYARIGGSSYTYEGFHLDHFDQNVVVRAEGDSILNVYYNRNVITLTFYKYGKPSSSTPVLVGGSFANNQEYSYYTVDADGNFSAQKETLYYRDGKWYRTKITSIAKTPAVGTQGAEGEYYTSANPDDTATAYLYYNDADGKWYDSKTIDYTPTSKRQNGRYYVIEGGSWSQKYLYYYDGTFYKERSSSGWFGYSYSGAVSGSNVSDTLPDYVWGNVESAYVGTDESTYEDLYDGNVYDYSTNTGSQWYAAYVFSGLYGTTLADNGYTWPEDMAWYDEKSGSGTSGTRTTFLDEFLLSDKNQSAEEFYGNSTLGSREIVFYKQDVDGNGYTQANVVKSNSTRFSISDKYSGFVPYEYRADESSSWTRVGAKDKQYYGDPVSYSSKLEIRFNRTDTSITYMDGSYFTGRDVRLDDYASRGELKAVSGITFGADISSYGKGQANYYEPESQYPGFVFEGWYTDDTCTHEYTFDNATLPESGLTLYAKWRQVEYRVFMHPNATFEDGSDDESLDWGGDQSTSFRVAYNATVDEVMGTRTGMELVGWYTDAAFTQPFGFGAVAINDDVAIAYDKAQPTELDKYGNPDLSAPGNKDASRFWINKKLDLYAKWRTTLDGAKGITVQYVNANGEMYQGGESVLYADAATAYATAAPTGDSEADEHFKYWVMQKWNGEEFVDTDEIVYPGGTFTVKAAYAQRQQVAADMSAAADDESEVDYDTYSYTVQLRAVNGPADDLDQTFIQFEKNADDAAFASAVEPRIDFQTNTEQNLLGATDVTRTGYELVGWSLTPGEGNSVDFKLGAKVSADNLDREAGNSHANTLYAVWKIKQFDVTFVDEDGKTVLKETAKYDYGTEVDDIDVPENPEKEATAEYTYTFTGWTPELSPVTEDVVYKATYKATKNIVTIKWVDEDGTELATEDVEYGTLPVYSGKTPTKEASAQYTYSFDKWTPAVVEATEDATYTATYAPTTNKYNVRFVVDGEEVSSGEYEYGATPANEGETPAREATAQYTYTFAGWTPAITSVTGNTTYTAKFDSTVNKYTVKWLNDDATVLETDSDVEYGTTPEYNGAEPTKASDAQYDYTFDGWNVEVAPVTGDVEYTATYTQTLRSYKVTWKNDNGDILETDAAVQYGTTPTYDGDTPEKAATAQYTYTFAGWTPAVAAVTGDVTYTATYTSTVNTYSVTWVDENGTTVLETDEGVAYGAMPEYNGATPTKAADARYTYKFDKWSPDIVAVSGNATYVATYTYETNKYTVRFVADGKEISSKDYDYGTAAANIEVPADPTKASDAQYTYTFANWDEEIADVTGPATYTAVFDSTVNEYVVTFVNDDDTELQSTSCKYGDLPEYTGETPTKASDAQYDYAFAGWTPEIASVTDEATYKAVYTKALRSYAVAFVDEDGTVLQNGSVEYGKKPVYTGTTPTKTSDAQYDYAFGGWDKEIVEVDGEAVYTATYTPTLRSYKVTFKDYDGSTFSEESYAYGTAVADIAIPENPQRGSDARYTYAFAGWSPAVAEVTGEATYTATYTPTLRSYTIRFINYDGTELSSEQYEYGTAAADVAEPENPTRDSTVEYVYTFNGWDRDITDVAGNATYTATYLESLRSYTVSFNPDGGVESTEGSLDDQIVDYGYTVTRPDDPVRDGYVFNGWALDGEPYDFSTMYVTGDTTLVAQWVQVKVVDIEITGNVDSVMYDGRDHRVEGYEVVYKVDGNVVEFEEGSNPISLTNTLGDFAEARNAGTYQMNLSVVDPDEGVYSGFSAYAVEPVEETWYLPGEYQVGEIRIVRDGKLTIGKRSIVLTSASADKEYDGSALTANGTEAITVTGDGFVAGESFTYDITGSQTTVGSSLNTFTYEPNGAVDRDENGQIANYEITTNFGTLTVKTRNAQYEVTITAASDTAMYDGDEHSVAGFVGEDGSVIPNGQRIPVTVEGSDSVFYVEGLTASASGTDVVEGGYANAISGAPVVYDAEEDGNDVSEQFAVSVEPGTLTIEPRPVLMVSASDEKVYDGTALTNDAVTADATEAAEAEGDTPAVPATYGFVEGQGATYTVTGSQTDAGSSDNAFTYALNENTKAVNYAITQVEGTLTVTQAPVEQLVAMLELAAKGYEGKYDGARHTVSVDATKLPAGTTVSYQNSGEPGFAEAAPIGWIDASENPVTVKAVNDNYDGEATVDVAVNIAKRDITIASAPGSKEYDGLPLTNSAISFKGDGFVGNEGDRITYNVTGSQTEVGRSANTFEYMLSPELLGASGDDAKNYSITKEEGQLVVNDRTDKWPVSASSQELSVKYDGYEKTAGGLVGADENGVIEFTVDGVPNLTFYLQGLTSGVTKTDAGTYANPIVGAAKITVDSVEGYDVTDQFLPVEKNEGQLVIGKREVTLTSAGATKPYDGTALTNDGEGAVTVGGDGFAANEGATFSVTGSQTLPGSSENVFTYTLNEGTIASNYDINQSAGDLVVTSRSAEGSTVDPYAVMVTGASAEKMYNGVSQTVSGFVGPDDTVIANYSRIPVVAANGLTYYVEGLSSSAQGADVTASGYATTVSGEARVFDAEIGGNDLTSEFLVGSEAGTLMITKRGVVLASGDAERAYTGLPLSNHTVTVGGDGFAAGQGATYRDFASQTAPGRTSNTFAYDLAANTSAGNYDISQQYGTLIVNNRDAVDLAVEVELPDIEQVYSGEEQTETVALDSVDVTVDGVAYAVSGLSATATGTNANDYAWSIVGTPVVTDADGVDVSTEFNVVPTGTGEGDFTITKRPVTLTSDGATKEYDGTALVRNAQTNVTATELAEGVGFVEGQGVATYAITGSQLIVGDSDNEFTYVLNANTNADNYDIETVYGKLNVTDRAEKYALSMVANSGTATYNGGEQYVSGFEADTFRLAANGQSYSVSGLTTGASGTDAATYATETTGTAVVADAYGNDVSSQFAVSVTEGALTINKKSVTIAPRDAEKVYDGTPLVASEYDVDGFVAGQGLATVNPVTFGGSQTRVGDGASSIESYRVNAETTNSDNYAVELDTGILTVTAPVPGVDDEVIDGMVSKVHVADADGNGTFASGEVVSYTISAVNIYDEPRTITITDSMAGVVLANTAEGPNAAIDGGVAVFDAVPAGAVVTLGATYAVTEADIAAGAVLVNEATVNYDGNDNDYVAADAGVTPDNASGTLGVAKEIVDPLPAGEVYSIGDTIDYVITVTNTGNVTLTNVVVSDQLARGAGAVSVESVEGAINGYNSVTFLRLAPGETREVRASYTVARGDAGSTVANNAAVRADDNDASDDIVPSAIDTAVSGAVQPDYAMVVNYVYANGATAAPSYTARLLEGEGYNVISPTIAGYTANYGVFAGEMLDQDITLTVVYSPNIVPAPTPTPVVPGGGAAGAAAGAVAAAAPVAPAAPAAPAAATVTIDDEGNPLVESIEDDANALASGLEGDGAGDGGWALLNVIASILAVALAIFMVAGIAGRKEEEDDEGNRTEVQRHRIMRLAGLALAVIAVIALLLTQDFSKPMVMVDAFTVLFVVIAAANVVLTVLSRKESGDEPSAPTPAAA